MARTLYVNPLALELRNLVVPNIVCRDADDSGAGTVTDNEPLPTGSDQSDDGLSLRRFWI